MSSQAIWLSALGLAFYLLRVAAQPAAAPGQNVSLPQVETALWIDHFAAVVGQQADSNATLAVIEEAIRDQFAEAGYGIHLLTIVGCSSGVPVANAPGYLPPPPAESPTDSVEEIPAPASALPPDDPFFNLPSPLLVRADCYKLVATIYFEPNSDIYLNATVGTSNSITQAISNQTLSNGVQADLYLRNVTLAPSITSVVSAGATLQHITEVGYLSAIWVSGSNLIPFEAPEQIAMLAVFTLLQLPQTTGVDRNKVFQLQQNATGVNVTYLTVVRPTAATLDFPTTFTAMAQNGSMLSALRRVGLPAVGVSLQSITQDNRTTLSSQLSQLLSDKPVVSAIGTTPVAPAVQAPSISGTVADPVSAHSSLTGGAIAGIVVGSIAAAGLVALLGACYLKKGMTKLAVLESGVKVSDAPPSPPPVPPPSADVSPHTGSDKWESPPTSLPISHWSRGTWQLDPMSITICRQASGIDHVLGSGSFGVVYKGVMDGTKSVAVKMLKGLDDWRLQQFRREIELLRSLSHSSHVVQFYGACLTGESPFLVLEFMEGGDLRDALSDPRFSPQLDWNRKGQKIALDIVRGLMFLHSKNVIHADLKSKNVLLSQDLSRAKIADVGLSRIMVGSHASSASDAVGTFSYAAPEQILGYKLTPKVDSFALSVLLWEIITKDPPARGQLYTIEAPKHCPPEIVALIEQGMDRNPRKRPSARQAYDIIISVSTEEDRYSDLDIDEISQLEPFSIHDTGEEWQC